jgi:SNF2 family DNA or RNA helicase
VALPDLLKAADKGDTTITLPDGSVGVLPEDWLRKYGFLTGLGEAEGGVLKFSKNQASLLDSMLASQPDITFDDGFDRARKSLQSFQGIQPLDPPNMFQGELRPYQREGLGWLNYLEEFQFGGVLADDMGLGKTVQVLAQLARWRESGSRQGPSLIVVPKSLIFNWVQEASRFAPDLRVLDYTGPNRQNMVPKFRRYDLIVTTYGTLRSDIVELSKIEFDYVILDEAQAIKNADSQAAKAARLLKGKNRLAMSGTPIENHLGELWSLFEFINPGMLGTASVFKRLALAATGSDPVAREALAKSLRPFILRRTKKQVVKDLPEKTEQILHCDLEPEQRAYYDQLREHYRLTLLKNEASAVSGGKFATNKIEVLEALLRLRQAACHPGLIDPDKRQESSAKLDILLPHMEEVIEEGHKVLIFSQFTSFLSIVRERFEKLGVRYEYLDGKTRDREARVQNFQDDPTISVFLISLKAGGLGLNLTSADYVYLLDPWWNPAVEAQAIDRSHRIGQKQHVFAYRLIASDTVEQKIINLQAQKRDLADAILGDDNRVIQSLTREDLEYLLS